MKESKLRRDLEDWVNTFTNIMSAEFDTMCKDHEAKKNLEERMQASMGKMNGAILKSCAFEHLLRIPYAI